MVFLARHDLRKTRGCIIPVTSVPTLELQEEAIANVVSARLEFNER